MFAASKSGAVQSAPKDAQFNYVTMLLHGDGTNGAQNNTFLDSSSNAFTITRNGNTTQGSFSPYGNGWSNYFGGSDYLSVPYNANFCSFGTGDFTVECWANISSVAYSALLTSMSNTITSAMWLLGFSNTSNEMTFGMDSGGVAVCGADYSSYYNKWTHIAASRSGSTLKLFFNGVQVASVSNSTNFTGDSGNAFVIGRRYTNQAAYGASGYISNVRIVKGTALYTSAFTPSTTPLTAVSGTGLLTCQSNRFIDNSSYQYTVSVAGGSPSVQRFNPFGTSTAYSTATIGGSGYFDGSGDWLTVANNSAFTLGSTWSMEAWVYQTTLTGSQTVVGRWYSPVNNASYLMYIGGGTIIGGVYPDYGNNSGLTTVANQWNHVVMTCDGTTIRFFLNGKLGTVATGVTTNISVNGSLNLTVGGNTSTGAELSGYISDVRLVKGAIPTNYQTSSTAFGTQVFTPPTAPLTAVANTSLLLSMQNGAIYDNAMMNDLETVGNAQISTSVKKYGTGSMYFDGTGDYLYDPSTLNWSFGSGNFTMELWLNSTSSNQYASLLSADGAGSAGFSFLLNSTANDGKIVFYEQYLAPSLLVTSTGGYNDGNWHHVALVRNGTSLVIYVDGTSQASSTTSATASTPYGLCIGNSLISGSRALTGYIDDLRITKGYARYTTTFTPPTAAFPNTGPN